MTQLPSEVAERIGPFYVYVLVDPRNEQVFYVGKGTGDRLLSHGRDAALTEAPIRGRKRDRILEIQSGGIEPRIDVVRHGLSEEAALLVEAALIDSLPELTNQVRGHGADDGRTSVSELIQRYGAEPLDPTLCPPAIVIRLRGWTPAREEIQSGYWRDGNGYRPGMTLEELCDSARAWWRISPDRVRGQDIRYAVAVFEGVTRGIMEIGDWIGPRADGRWSFHAEPLISGDAWQAWIGQFGRRMAFPQGSQSPTLYWPRS